MYSLKSLVITLIVILITNTCFSQTTVTIGSGTSTSEKYPFNGNYNYGWSNVIYLASEINTSGDITKLSFYVGNSPSNFTMNNQRIMMKHTTATGFSNSNQPDTSTYTVVFSGSITYNGSGWKDITFTTPFAYNGTDNLDVYYENRDGSYASGYPTFRYTSGYSNYRVRRDYKDSGFPNSCYNCDRFQYVLNTKITLETCTTNAGTASIDKTNGCYNDNASLTLSSYQSGSSIQWQSSTDNLNFSNISGATSSNYTSGSLTTSTYYRAAVTNGCTKYSNSVGIAIAQNNANYNMQNATIYACNGNFYDEGGTGSNYTNNKDYTLTFKPCSTGTKLVFSFSSFNVENHASCGYDYLKIYDGPNTSSTLLGTYCGTNNPGTVVSTASDGSLTFVFHSDAGTSASGWAASINCCTTLGGTATAQSSPICSGSSTSISLSGYTSGATIQWQNSTNNTTFSNISGATSNSYTTPNLTTTTYYRAAITAGGCTVYSTTATVTVNSAPTATANLSGGSACSPGAAVTLSATGITSGATFTKWQSSYDNVNFTDITGGTTNNFTVYPNKTSYYRAVISNACEGYSTTVAYKRNYYVNDNSTSGDVFTNATGNNANDGRSPYFPKASVQAIIDAYTLAPCDTLFIDLGNYTESISFNSGEDGSFTAGITLYGADKNNTVFTAPSGSHNIVLTGADYINIQNLKLVNTSSGNYNIYLNGSTGDLIKDNVLSHTGDYNIYVAGNSTASNRNKILSNTISNTASSKAAINVGGNSDYTEIGNNTINATGTNYTKGINLVTTTSYFPKGTKIYNNTLNSKDWGIYLDGYNNDIDSTQIYGNNINITTKAQAIGAGIYMLNVGSTSGEVTRIYNNRIIGGQNGLYFEDGVDYVNIYNNYISNNDRGINSATSSNDNGNLYFNSFNNSVDNIKFSGTSIAAWNVQNNIFYNTGSGASNYCINIGSTSATFISCNYNNYYTPNGAKVAKYGSDYATLTNWQGVNHDDASGNGDGNSVNGNPLYTDAANNNLDIPNNSAAALTGVTISGYTTDIYSMTRNTPPSIGADEATPSANAGNDVTICSGTNTQLNATGGTTYSWSPATGLSSTSIANPVASPSSTTTYTVTATTGNQSSTDQVTVTVNATPSITNTTPGSNCGTGAVNLGATASAGTINWYAASSGGSSLGSGTSFTTPSISTTTTYYVDATINGCTTATRTAVVATIKEIPSITTTTPGSNCGTGTVNIGATASAGTINWYAASSGDTSLGTGTSFTTPSISTTTTYYVDATHDGCTTTSRTPVIATINEMPSITSITPGSRCATGTVNLGATASAGTINWYDVTSGGSSLSTGTSFVTPSISTTTTYYVDATSNGCTTASRTSVTATVNSIPQADAGADKNLLIGETVTIGTSAVAGINYLWSPSTYLNSTTTATTVVTPVTNITYTLTVTDENECSGIDTVKVNIDGAIIDAPYSHVNSDTMSFSHIFDRLGNTYNISDIQRQLSNGSGRSDDPVIPSLYNCLTGNPSGLLFQLEFVGNGFEINRSPFADSMQSVICQVLGDLAYMIQPSNCNGELPIVNIKVQFPDDMNPNHLGSASSYYTSCCPNDQTGILDGDVWKAINTGANDPTLYDGYINVNLSYGWNFNYTSTNFNQYDAYTVFLHEVMHAMGFNSLIGPNGQSLLSYPNSPLPSNFYSRFDTYLQSVSGSNNLIDWDGCYNADYALSTSVITSGNAQGCGGVNFVGTNTSPVFAPSTFLGGSTLSHFENNCGGSNNYVMSHALAPGQYRRIPTNEEITAFCDIGYQTTGNFGTTVTGLPSCGGVVAGLNDGYADASTCNDSVLVLQSCSTITFNPLHNDINTVTYECLKVAAGFGTISASNGTTFTYDPQGYIGINYLTYIPVSSSGQRGNITTIKIVSMPCGDDGTCATPLNCNQVCNPDFSDVYGYPGATWNSVDPFNNGNVGAWLSSHGSPQIGNAAGPDQFAAMWSALNRKGEGIISWVNVQPGKDYIFSYERRLFVTDSSQNPIDNIHVFLIPEFSLGATSSVIPLPPSPNFRILHEKNVSSTTFEQVTVCFRIPDTDSAYKWLWIYPEQTPGTGGVAWAAFDKINLVEDYFTAGPDTAIACGSNVMLGEQLCSVPNVLYQWREISPNTNTVGSGNPTTLANLEPGVYQYTLTRGFLTNPNTVFYTPISTCRDIDTMTVTVTGTLAIDSINVIHPTCQDSNGVIIVNESGGVPPYQYEVENITPLGTPVVYTTQTVNNLGAGVYAITVRDSNGCEVRDTVVLNDIGSPTLSFAHTNVSCEGAANGTATVTPSGGTPPYTYAWINNQITQTATGLDGNTYYVTVTDSNGCMVSDTVTIHEPAGIYLGITDSAATCPDGNNGYLAVTAAGGTPPYSYLWSPGNQTTNSISGLSAGTYSITVTDTNGCTKTAQAIISPRGSLPLTITGALDPHCHGGFDGTATVTVQGGSGYYHYIWNDSLNQQTATATGLFAGTYTVQVIDDSTGCEGLISITLTDPNTNIIDTVYITDVVLCFGDSTGAADLQVSGGVAPYTYVWIKVTPPTIDTIAFTQDVSGLPAGIYYVTVTDSTGDCSTIRVEIKQPTAVSIIPVSITHICFNDSGAINVSVVGGTSPYTYSWSPGGQTTEDIANITLAGTHTLTVTDAHNCTTSKSFNLLASPEMLITDSAINVSCYGDSSGAVYINFTGGISPFSYQWSNGDSTKNITGLSAGTYTLTITDSIGCTATHNVTITQPDSIWFTDTVITHATCYGLKNGTISINVNGGTAPYTYSWSNGQTTAAIDSLPSGNYTLTVTDSLGCSRSVTITVTQPSDLSGLGTTVTHVACRGDSTGAINLAVSGGTPPYTYSWSNGATTQDISNLPAGTYTITVTDTNGCSKTTPINITQPASFLSAYAYTCGNNIVSGTAQASALGGTAPYTYSWSNGQTTALAVGLSSNTTYTVIVTDNHGCKDTAQTTVVTNAVITSVVHNTNCNNPNGSATVTPIGGTAPFTYSWNNGQTNATATGLAAGYYTVRVTDSSNCSVWVNVSIGGVTLPVSISAYPVCKSALGTATANPTGGTPPYTYNWSNGDNNQTTDSLTVGTSYTVTVTDSFGCAGSAQITPVYTNLALTITGTAESCPNDSDGTATVTPTGGYAPYTYEWSSTPTQTTQTATGLPAGTYVAYVTDSIGCQEKMAFEVLTFATISYNTDSLCIGESQTGSATVVINAGTPPFTYSWSNGQTTQTATGLVADSLYTVTVSGVSCSINIPAIASCADFWMYDCHVFLDTTIFTRIPSITHFFVKGWVYYNDSTGNCTGPRTTIGVGEFSANYPSPDPASNFITNGWWSTATNAIDSLKKHINLTDDHGMAWDNNNFPYAFSIPPMPRDYSFQLFAYLNNNTTLGSEVPIGAPDCIYFPYYACSGPPNSKLGSGDIAGAKEIDSVNMIFTVQPNPNNGSFVVKIQNDKAVDQVKVIITNVTGQIIENEIVKLKNNSFVFDKTLSNGVYFITINKDDYYSTRRIVIIN